MYKNSCDNPLQVALILLYHIVLQLVKYIVRQAVIHNEQAMQCFVKSSIDPAPGGQTGEVLDSLTVDSFDGTGTLFSWPWLNVKYQTASKEIRQQIYVTFVSFMLRTFWTKQAVWDCFIGTDSYTVETIYTAADINILVQEIDAWRFARYCTPSAMGTLTFINLILNKEIFEISPSNVPTTDHITI